MGVGVPFIAPHCRPRRGAINRRGQDKRQPFLTTPCSGFTAIATASWPHLLPTGQSNSCRSAPSQSGISRTQVSHLCEDIDALTIQMSRWLRHLLRIDEHGIRGNPDIGTTWHVVGIVRIRRCGHRCIASIAAKVRAVTFRVAIQKIPP